MKTTTAFSALATLAVASPVANSKTYAIKANAPGAKFDNLCLSTYHTIAGRNDVIFSACNDKSNAFYDYNGGIASTLFDQSIDRRPSTGIQLLTNLNADDWFRVMVNAGEPKGNVTYTATDGFRVVEEGGSGFLACPWAHQGLDQLFFFGYGANGTSISLPSSCAEVKLFKA